MKNMNGKIIRLDGWEEDKKAKSITYFSLEENVTVSKEMIDKLKEISKANEKRNARFCLHNLPSASLHDMIILEYRDKKCRKPHKHLEKDETLHMIEGEMLVLIFNDAGKLLEKVILSPENNFSYRANKGFYHVWLPKTEYVIYREIKQGPFKQEDNVPPEFNHAVILKEYAGFDLSCYNKNCNQFCSLSKIKK